MQYCRTNKAIEWLYDGDTIHHIATDCYFKKEGSEIISSSDAAHWKKFDYPLEIFPPYDEWRSISNLHYYDDVLGEKLFLTPDDEVLKEDDPRADKAKKRWFAKIL